MKLSSALLPAMALLVHTASGFRLRVKTYDAQARTIDYVASAFRGHVGFYNLKEAEMDVTSGSDTDEDEDFTDKPVDIILVGNEMQTGFVLQKEWSGVWAFKPREDGVAIGPGDLTAPFDVVDDEFIWVSGHEDAKWLLCGKPHTMDIYLAINNQDPSHTTGYCRNAKLYEVRE